MKYPTTRFVFDRKKTATKQKDALIQIEVLHERKKKYISTGVKVYKDQWTEKAYVINRNDMLELNERIKGVKKNVDDYITKLITNNQAFEWDAFERFLTQAETTKMTFIDYVYKRISERNDITASTKKAHMKLISSLMDYGKIIGFEQLTRPNVADYYDWLLGHDIIKIGHDGREYTTQLAPITAWSYMKLLRTYIHDAMLHELINFDPSMGIKVKKGDSEQTRWLSLEEVKKLEETEMPTGSLARVRDLFIYSCYTGLAYSDLMDFKPEKLENDGENTFDDEIVFSIYRLNKIDDESAGGKMFASSTQAVKIEPNETKEVTFTTPNLIPGDLFYWFDVCYFAKGQSTVVEGIDYLEVTVVDKSRCDINSDGEVNESDVEAIANHIIGNTPDNFNVEAADLNGDEKVNVADVVILNNILLEQ